MIGCDLTASDDPLTMALLTNREVIAMNQHSINNREAYRKGDVIAWTAETPDGKSVYLAVFNTGNEKTEIMVPFKGLKLKKSSYRATDLWNGKSLGTIREFAAPISGHGVVLCKLE